MNRSRIPPYLKLHLKVNLFNPHKNDQNKKTNVSSKPKSNKTADNLKEKKDLRSDKEDNDFSNANINSSSSSSFYSSHSLKHNDAKKNSSLMKRTNAFVDIASIAKEGAVENETSLQFLRTHDQNKISTIQTTPETSSKYFDLLKMENDENYLLTTEPLAERSELDVLDLESKDNK
jgi:hypothetical protein